MPAPVPVSAPTPDAYVSAEPVAAKPIGHTSYVLKLTLEGGAVAVFKPRSRRPLGDRRYKGEIAAYRLATALGLENVPRAIPRRFAAARLRAVEPHFDEEALVDADGGVRGALVPWIERYRVLPLEQPKERERWEPWVFDARDTVPGDQRSLASAIATMIAFDYLTANWDRWSGGNVAEDEASGRVLFVDNDGAFYDPPDLAGLARQRAQVERLVRFSRSFVARLRALDEPRLRTAFGDESPGVPLLADGVLRGVDARRRTVLQAIDARIGDAGEDATLAFP